MLHRRSVSLREGGNVLTVRLGKKKKQGVYAVAITCGNKMYIYLYLYRDMHMQFLNSWLAAAITNSHYLLLLVGFRLLNA